MNKVIYMMLQNILVYFQSLAHEIVWCSISFNVGLLLEGK